MKNTNAKPNKQDFHITVGVQPTKDLNLDKEIRLVKAAILYGDKVKLYSPKIPSLLAISRFENFPANLRLEFFEKIIPHLSSKENAQRLSVSLNDYKKILNKQNLDVHELQLKKDFEKKLESSWKDIADTTNQFVENSQMEQINSAVKAGVLELHDFKNSDKDTAALNLMIEGAAAISASKVNEKTTASEQDQAWISEFVENISNSMSDNSTYPLLDDETGNSVSEDIKSGKLKASSFEIDRGKQTEFSRYLLERLPLFENASISEILDIRKELEQPLTRFRSAMINFSDDIKSTPWEKGFTSEANRVYVRDVKPALLEIEESVQSNTFFKLLLEKIMEKPLVLPVSSGISFAVSQISSLPKELVTSLGVGIAYSPMIYKAYDDWKKKKQITEQNQLYFYYDAGKRLSR